MKKILFSIIVPLLTAFNTNAQQDPHYSLYLFNQLPYNPATTADREVMTLNGQYRNQWLTLDGAPKTTHLNFQTPFGGGRNGLGIGITADRIGMTAMNSLTASYAYRFPISVNSKLSLGLQGSLDQFKISWEKAKPLDPGDANIPAAAATETGANFGLGAQLAGKRYYIGVGLPKMMATKLYSDRVNSDKGAVRSIYLTGGLSFPITEKVDLLPAALMIVNKHHPTEVELALQTLFNKKFGVGANLRVGDSFDVFAMYKINQHLRAGFAWDFTTSKLNQVNDGSFEIMLGYQFGKSDQPKCSSMEDVRFF